MDASSAYLATALVAALVGSCLVAAAAMESLLQRTRASAARKSEVGGSALAALVRNGVPALYPLAVRALRFAPYGRLCRRLVALAAERGVRSSEAAVSSLVGAGAAGAVLLGAVLSSAALGAVIAGLAISLLSAWVATSAEKRRDDMREQLPDALRAMAACFHAGFTLSQTFSQLEHETQGSLGKVFGQAASALGTGSTAREALGTMRQTADVPELSFVAVALEVQHQSGGSMQHVLDATGDMLKNELDLRRSLRVHTAQARLSARVVVAVTIGLVAALMALTDNFLGPFFESPVGLGLLATAVGMQMAGIMVIRRLLRVEVD